MMASTSRRSSRGRWKTQGFLADYLSLSRHPAASSESRLRFRKTWRFPAPFRTRLLLICAKRRAICSIEKSDVLCFQVLLSFVPTIFLFLRDPRDSPNPGNFESCRVPALADPCRSECGVKKLEFCIQGTHCALNWGSFWVRS